MFRSYMWTIFRLRFLTYRLVMQDVWGIWVGGGGGGGGTRSRCLNSGYHDPELLEVNFLYFHFYTVQELRYISKIANHLHPCLFYLDIQF